MCEFLAYYVRTDNGFNLRSLYFVLGFHRFPFCFTKYARQVPAKLPS
jgi:hypothetical protein